MAKQFFKYSYWDAQDKANQYSDLDYEETFGVDARYIRRETDLGNPFIEALPRPRQQADLVLYGVKGIPGYDHQSEIKKEIDEQLSMILKLKDVRFLLPMNIELEDLFYMALINSYRARKLFRDADGDIKVDYTANNTIQKTDGILIGQDADAASTGITLIGYSGCGKSTALKTLLGNYPQYIIHHGSGMVRYPQIVYLVVQCPPHSNFRGLYHNIGIALDRALGNLEPVYAKELDSNNRNNLSAYTEKVRQLIEKFSIGMIILDEIQHLSFTTSLENSFESILELANQTKVAFGVVGTEEAYEKLFAGNLRQSRRLGAEIRADRYCKNFALFRQMVLQLFEYQWFDPLVVPTEEIINTLYQHTRGIVDQLIRLYIHCNYDFVRARKKPVVNAAFIAKVSEKYYPGTQSVFYNISKAEEETAHTEMLRKDDDGFHQAIQEEQEKRAEKIALATIASEKSDICKKLKEYAISRIKELDDEITDGMLERACNDILASNEGQMCVDKNDALQFTKLVNKHLKTSRTPKQTKTEKGKKPDITIVRNFLLNDTPPEETLDQN